MAQTKDLLGNVNNLDRAAFREAFTEIRRNRDTDSKLVVEEVCQPLNVLLCLEFEFMLIRHING